MIAAAAWLAVEKVYECGKHCDGCPHLKQWYEHHGPGLDEPMSECLVLSGDDPSLCPIVKESCDAHNCHPLP